MKRILFALAVLVSAISPTAAHEIYAGFGFSPTISIPKARISYTFTLSSYSGDTNCYGINKHTSNAFTIGYYYNINRRFAVGPSYTHFGVTYNELKSEQTSAHLDATLKTKSNVIMVNAKYEWVAFSKFSFYSRAGIGFNMISAGKMTSNNINMSFDEATKTDIGFAWQATPLGVDWNAISHLSVFAEGGIGADGYCVVGVKAKF